uniref:Beta-N-acetylhexosaminidase n=1 Tax=Panagrolaimus sp. JU765 TaxID=591449 RepID=A0AC34RI97_9BILA
MWFIFFHLVLPLISGQEFLTAPPPGLRTEGEVWPLPQEISKNDQIRKIGNSKPGPIKIQFEKDFERCDVLQFARRTYLSKWAMPFGESNDEDSNEITLKVRATGDAVLDANEVWGALRGLETFSQLIFWKNDSYWIRTSQIHDFPRFPLRGVLIDTSRHYLPPPTIKRQIDIMAQNKMNVLHWHIVDIESFPYVSQKFPNLHEAGAFSPRHVYTPETVQDIIHYARLRGIRVMVEIDTPGHTGSWKGQPGFLAECREFFTEILEVFPEKFLHLGGDEVSFFTNACWFWNPKIREFMNLHGFGENITALEDYYFSKLQKVLKPIAKDRTQVFWQEVFDNNKPAPGSIIHVWKGSTATERNEELARVTAAGFQVILSSCWYLNYINYGADWKDGATAYYYCDPQDFEGSDQQKKLVIGGVAAMWGEFVDATNIEARLWPRASAVAERLWSNKNATTNAEKAWPRLHEHRCRLLARGFRVQPGNGPSFCPIEWSLP